MLVTFMMGLRISGVGGRRLVGLESRVDKGPIGTRLRSPLGRAGSVQESARRTGRTSRQEGRLPETARSAVVDDAQHERIPGTGAQSLCELGRLAFEPDRGLGGGIAESAGRLAVEPE